MKYVKIKTLEWNNEKGVRHDSGNGITKENQNWDKIGNEHFKNLSGNSEASLTNRIRNGRDNLRH